MGITDLWSDFVAAVSFTELHAEAPQDDKKEDDKEEESKEEEKDDSEDKEENEDDVEEAGNDDEEEEEEEEEEPEDPKPKLEDGKINGSNVDAETDELAECARSAQCGPYKHHFDDCVKRVTAKEEAGENKGQKEDCVEECKFNRSKIWQTLTRYSLSLTALRNAMCCPKALQAPQIDESWFSISRKLGLFYL